MFIYRYNIINQSIAPVDAIASPQDDSFAPTQYASGLYFLQSTMKDQWVDAIQPLGMDAQLIADWNQIMTVAQRSYYMNVHNVVAAMALLGQIINKFTQHIPQASYGGSSRFGKAPYLDPSQCPQMQSFMGKYEQMLQVSPTIAQVRAFLIYTVDLKLLIESLLSWCRVQEGIEPQDTYHFPDIQAMSDYFYGNAGENAFIASNGFSNEMQTLGQFDITIQNAAEDQLVMQYAAGAGALAQYDASQALAQMNTVQQDMYNFAGQLNAFVHDPTAPADLQSQLAKENVVPTIKTWDPPLGMPIAISPKTSSPTYNAKPAIQTLPAQRVGSVKNVEITGVPVMPAQTVVHTGGTAGNLGVIHAANVSAHMPAKALAEPAVAPTSSHVSAGNVTHRNTPTVSAAAGSQTAASAPAAATPHHVASMGMLVAAGAALLFLL